MKYFSEFLTKSCTKFPFFSPIQGHPAGFSRLSSATLQVYKASHIIHQIQKTYLRSGPQPPDTSDEPSVHGFNHGKHMFYPGTYLGFLAILSLLKLRKGCIPTSLPADTVFVPKIIKAFLAFLRRICAIGIHIRIGIRRVKNVLKYLGVMNLCRCCLELTNQLMLRIDGRMVLVTKKCLIVFLRPSRIDVFLVELRRLFLPFLRSLPIYCRRLSYLARLSPRVS